MREAQPKFAARGARIAVVAQGGADDARSFCDQRGVSDLLLCLADPHREAYRAFGLERGSVNRVMGPKVLAAGLRAWRHGLGLPGRGQDPMQLGGAFVIDRTGQMRLAHRDPTSADHATVDELLAALPA